MVQVSNPDPNVFGDPAAFKIELEKAQKSEMQLHDTHQQFPSVSEEQVPQEKFENIESDSQQNDNPTRNDSQFEESTEVKSHLIPKSRLDKEIEKRRTIEAELQTQREEKIRYQTQLEMVQKMHELKQEQPKFEPVKLDPLDPDAFNYQNQRFEELQQKIEQASQQSHMQQLAQQVSLKEMEFSSRTPDYTDAVNYVKDLQMKVARDMFGNDKDAADKVTSDMRDIVLNSIRNGRNPAENIYNMAKQYGYKSRQKAPNVNLDAVERNANASVNTSGLNTNVAMGSGPIDIRQSFDERGRVDPAKFAELIQKAQKQPRSGY